MSFVIQDNYKIHQSKAIAGSFSRVTPNRELDIGIAGEDLVFGEAVYFDEETETYKAPNSDDTQVLSVGIVFQERNLVHEAGKRVVIKAGDSFEFVKKGHVFVFLAEDVKKGKYGFYNKDKQGFSDNKDAGLIVTPMIFEESGVAGDFVSISINGQIMPNIIKE